MSEEKEIIETEGKEEVTHIQTSTILENWIPRTELGRKVINGEITSIEEILKRGYLIREPEIVDYLVPDLESAVITIGGSPGKGGGIKRTPIKSTTRVHKSGRKRTVHAMVVVGKGKGYVGLGYADALDARKAIEKATKAAKLNIIPVRRGCGSWECNCKGNHSIPFKARGKTGSVTVEMMPGPRGLGLVAAPELKRVLALAGIKDIWMKSRGQTKTRTNFIKALFDAFEDLNNLKIHPDKKEFVGLKE